MRQLLHADKPLRRLTCDVLKVIKEAVAIPTNKDTSPLHCSNSNVGCLTSPSNFKINERGEESMRRGKRLNDTAK